MRAGVIFAKISSGRPASQRHIQMNKSIDARWQCRVLEAEDNQLMSWTSAPLTQFHQSAAILGCPKRGHRAGQKPEDDTGLGVRRPSPDRNRL